MRRAPSVKPNTVGLIEKYINSQFDRIDFLYQHLEEVIAASRILDLTIDSLFFRYEAVAGQTVFTGPDLNNRTMMVPGNSPMVYVNRVLADSASYVLENSNTQVRFLAPLEAGDLVHIASFAFNPDGTIYYDDLLSQASIQQIVSDAANQAIAAAGSATIADGHRAQAAAHATAAANSAAAADASADTAALSADAAALSAAAAAALYNGPWLDDVNALLADTSLTYSAGQPGTVTAGDIVQTREEGFSYEVAASAAVNHHLITAGGVKLYVVTDSAYLTPIMFGASADGVADDLQEIQAAWDTGAAVGTPIRMDRSMLASDELKTSGNLHVKFSNGAWLKQTGVSTIGSFITNLRNSVNDTASIQNNILIENPQIDGAAYPAPEVGTAQGGGASTITLAAGASASDDYYNGLAVSILHGTGAGQTRFISGYVGASRVATVSAAWSTPPDATSVYQIGYNDNALGFAAGVSDVRVIGGVIRNYPHNAMTPAVGGAKGVNFEQGVTNGLVDGTTFINCGTAVFVQGLDGTWGNGSTKRTTCIQVRNVSAYNCGSLLSVFGINTGADPDGDSKDQLVMVSELTYENCGHAPWRIVNGSQQKSGVINFGEAQNVSVSNLRGRNDLTYPASYPSDYPGRVGYGLTGPVGAMIWGWGRNLKVSDFVHHGNVDNIIHISRCRALGDDASPSGQPRNCFDWDFRGIKHYGVITEYVIRLDPNPAYRVPAAELTGHIEVSVNGGFVGLGLVDPAMASYSGITLTLHDHISGKTVIGTPAQILAAGNSFSSYGSGVTDLRNIRFGHVKGRAFTMADDTAISITPPAVAGIVAVSAQSAALRFLFSYRTAGSSEIAEIGTLPSNCAINNTSGQLNGITGSDNFFTVRAETNGQLWFENRRGGTVDVTITFIG